MIAWIVPWVMCAGVAGVCAFVAYCIGVARDSGVETRQSSLTPIEVGGSRNSRCRPGPSHDARGPASNGGQHGSECRGS
jgi:hypothetical protein